MICFYDEILTIPHYLQGDGDRHIMTNDVPDTPEHFEILRQEYLDMTEWGGKIQYWLMDNNFDPNYIVITNKPERYKDLVPDEKIVSPK